MSWPASDQGPGLGLSTRNMKTHNIPQTGASKDRSLFIKTILKERQPSAIRQSEAHCMPFDLSFCLPMYAEAVQNFRWDCRCLGTG